MASRADAIRAWLASTDLNLRRAAVESAGRLGWEAAELAPELVQALDDEDKFVRRNSVVALGKVHPPPAAAVGPLIECVRRRDPDDLILQKLAAWALGRMGSTAASAIPALEELSRRTDNPDAPDYENEQTRANAARAIDAIRSAEETSRPTASFVVEPEKKVTVVRDVDVAVAGSGPAGLIAAVASARAGARAVLVEKHATVFPAIVYSGTAGIFNCFRAYTEAERTMELPGEHELSVREREKKTPDAVRSEGHLRQLIGGVAWDFIRHLVQLGGFIYRTELEALACRRLQVDPEVAQYGAITFLEEAGVDVLVQSPACAPIMDGDRVQGLFVENKSGRRAILAKTVVDCTGESDLAAAAGVPTALGRDLGAQSGSLLWVLENFPGEPDLPFRSGQDSANGPVPDTAHELAEELGFAIRRDLDGRSWTHYSLSGHGAFAGQYLDAGDGEDVSLAELQNRKYAFEFIRFCKQHVPGFENTQLRQVSPQILWRGARCIIGDYFMTKEAVDEKRRYDDAIYLHRAVRYGPNEFTQVPYGVLLPQRVEGLLVAGKCASGASSMRSTGSCMAMGQAAGVAAALSAQQRVTPRELDVRKLQDALREQGVLLDQPRRIAL